MNVCSSRAVNGQRPDGGASVPSSAAPAGSSIRASGLPAASSRIRRRRSGGSVSGARSRSASDASSSSPASAQLGQVGVVEGARQSLADGEEQDRRIRFDPSRDELEHLHGRPVQPVRVVDHDEQRSLGCPFGDQPQRREADQEQVGSVALGNPERRLECPSLRVGKQIEPTEQGKQQLVQAGEGERRLGERSRRGHDRRAPLSRPFPCSREQAADLPIPASPRTTERAAPRADPVDQRRRSELARPLGREARRLCDSAPAVANVHLASFAATLPQRVSR